MRFNVNRIERMLQGMDEEGERFLLGSATASDHVASDREHEERERQADVVRLDAIEQLLRARVERSYLTELAWAVERTKHLRFADVTTLIAFLHQAVMERRQGTPINNIGAALLAKVAGGVWFAQQEADAMARERESAQGRAA